MCSPRQIKQTHPILVCMCVCEGYFHFYRFIIRTHVSNLLHTHQNPNVHAQTNGILILFFHFWIKWILEGIQKNLINMKLRLIYKPHIDFLITLYLALSYTLNAKLESYAHHAGSFVVVILISILFHLLISKSVCVVKIVWCWVKWRKKLQMHEQLNISLKFQNFKASPHVIITEKLLKYFCHVVSVDFQMIFEI